MKQRLANLDSIIKALKPYLPQYLAEHGIETSNKTNFKCINPKHEDNNNSMHLYGETVHCFGCGSTYNINQVCSILEGKPSRGKGWIEENILYLAKKYNIHVDLEDLTQEEIYEYQTYSAYNLAANLIADRDFGDYSVVDKEIERRQWDKEKLALWGVGTVNYNDFRNRLRKAGFDANLLDNTGLSDPTLFSESNLIFTVTDEEGRPVGFSARRLDGGNGPRYKNTRQTGLECAIFKKGERLYGYDVAKEAPDPLYIFEGQANVITARHYGLMNCCCLMGANLTDHHINLLKRHGSFNIVLVLDGDQAGRDATEKAIDEKFSKERDFLVKLCQLPDNTDPDELIRESGYDAFVRLKRWTAFEWRMFKFMEQFGEEISDEDREDVANKMIPIIVSEKNYLRQEQMAKQVSKMTGFELAVILSEVKRRRNEKEAEIATRKTNAVESILYNYKGQPENIDLALTECQMAVAEINKSVHSENESSSTLNLLQAIKEEDEKKTGDFAGFYMRPDGMGGIANRLNEDWKSDTLIYIAGLEQSAKSTFLSQMIFEIVSDKRNNAIGLYFSVDDPAKRIAYKWICNAANNLNLQLLWVSNPNYWIKQEGMIVSELREKGYKKLLSYIQDGRLTLKDASDGTSLGYMKNIIRYHREKNPSSKLIIGIDSFHKLSDYGGMQEAQRTKRLSNDLKELAVAEHCTIACVAEYKKLPIGQVPDNDSLSQAKALSYDADVIIHLYNQLQQIDNEQKAVYIHEHDGKIYPRIRAKFGKNKISGYIGVEFLDLYNYSGVLKATDLDEVRQETKERMAFIEENKGEILP